jgi:hypothetical protein
VRAHPWNPADVVMIQATDQGGVDNPWKRQSRDTQAFHTQFEYLHADSEDALLKSIDPSLARTAESLHQRHTAQTDTIYDHNDAPTRRTFISVDRHVKVSADLIAERFGIHLRVPKLSTIVDTRIFSHIYLNIFRIPEFVSGFLKFCSGLFA